METIVEMNDGQPVLTATKVPVYVILESLLDERTLQMMSEHSGIPQSQIAGSLAYASSRIKKYIGRESWT